MPSKESIDEDCKREHHVYESQDGACQRSIELFVPLKMKAPKGNCVKWDQMLDLGAIGNFMSGSDNCAIVVPSVNTAMEWTIDSGCTTTSMSS